MIRDASKPGTPVHQLVVHRRNPSPVLNHPQSDRGKYRKLKKEARRHPEVLAHVKQLMGYRKVLQHQKVNIDGHGEQGDTR